jgi:hypothetical protein
MSAAPVTTTFHAPIAADPGAAAAALGRARPLRALFDGLVALGLGERLATIAGDRPSGLRLRLADGPSGAIEVDWRTSVEAAADGTSRISIAVRVDGTDDAARSRLAAAWSLLGPVLESHARRAIDAVRELAADDAFESEVRVRAVA